MVDTSAEPVVHPPLGSSEAQLARLLAGVRDCAIYMLNCDGHVQTWNAGAERIKGYTAEEILGRHFSEFYVPEDRVLGVPANTLSTAIRTGKFEGEGWRMRKDGSRFWASVLVDAIRDENDRLIAFAKITRDMTERRAMQEQLHQSQKMEAVGQLTGGVAHDFNNLLTVILGNLDMLAQQLPGEPPRWRRSVQHALRATERAAGLTQQLLSFARRQPLRPEAVDVRWLISRWSELIRRTLPENISIRLIEDPNATVVEIDPNHFENALLNLALNARDAMPNGGCLTLETAITRIADDESPMLDLTPGEYVLVCITDTGMGMPPEVLERALEPFFTTKTSGQGTGLGLSQVFGFVKQSGGHLRIYSRAGHGTTIKIYLPRAQHSQAAAEKPETFTTPPIEAHATILVVEDNEGVRTFTSETLRDVGFIVLEAADAAAALKIFENAAGVDLLFTDIGLPGLNGRELVATVHRRYPEVKLLFTSGYAQMVAPADTLTKDIKLVSKPFTRPQLISAVRDVLGIRTSN